MYLALQCAMHPLQSKRTCNGLVTTGRRSDPRKNQIHNTVLSATTYIVGSSIVTSCTPYYFLEDVNPASASSSVPACMYKQVSQSTFTSHPLHTTSFKGTVYCRYSFYKYRSQQSSWQIILVSLSLELAPPPENQQKLLRLLRLNGRQNLIRQVSPHQHTKVPKNVEASPARPVSTSWQCR